MQANVLFVVAADSADNIDQIKLSVEVNNQTEYGGEVRLKWEEPPEPNGIVVTYHIEYRRVDIENVSCSVAELCFVWCSFCWHNEI